LLELEMNIVPITVSMDTDGDSSMQVLPIQIRRELEMGIDRDVTVAVVGWRTGRDGDSDDGGNTGGGGNHPPNPVPSATSVNSARFSILAELAVDAVGLRTMHLTDGTIFNGVELANVEA